MRTDLSAEFLANEFERAPFDSIDRQYVGSERGVQFDGKPGGEIDPEVIVIDEQNAVRRQNSNQCLPD